MCMHTHTYTHAHTHTHPYLHTYHTHRYANTHAHTCIQIYTCAHTHLRPIHMGSYSNEPPNLYQMESWCLDAFFWFLSGLKTLFEASQWSVSYQVTPWTTSFCVPFLFPCASRYFGFKFKSHYVVCLGATAVQEFCLISRLWWTRSLGDGYESSQWLAWGKAGPTVCMSGPSDEWPIAD